MCKSLSNIFRKTSSSTVHSTKFPNYETPSRGVNKLLLEGYTLTLEPRTISDELFREWTIFVIFNLKLCFHWYVCSIFNCIVSNASFQSNYVIQNSIYIYRSSSNIFKFQDIDLFNILFFNQSRCFKSQALL